MFLEPGGGHAGPGAEYGVFSAEAEAVGAVLEDVKLERDFIFVARHGEEEAVFDGDGAIVGAVDEEAWGRLGSNLAIAGEEIDQGWVGIFAEEVVPGVMMLERIVHRDDGVQEDGEIGARAESVDRVGGVGLTVVEMCCGAGGEMTPGREADDAYALGVEIPFRCAGSDEAEGSLCVFEFDGVMIFGAQAVFENEAGDADAVEPLGDGFSLVGGEVHVSPAGADDESCAGGFARSGEEWGDGWDIDIGGALRAGGVVLPEADGGLGGCGRRFVCSC